MKPKHLKTLSLFNKSLPIFGISKRFSSIKIIFDKYKKILKSLFFKIYSHLFNLLEQVLFLAIILLFLFLLLVYFSQIKFLKKHSDFFNFSKSEFDYNKIKNLASPAINKIEIHDFPLLFMDYESRLCQFLLDPLKTGSNIKIDYG
jgi:hypothetical protein